MNLVSTEFDLPVFLKSRTQFRNDSSVALNRYIKKQRKLYAPLCKEVKPSENVVATKYQEILGLDKRDPPICPVKRPLATTRDLVKSRPWQLPANRYGIPPPPFEKKRGAGGAYWAKLHKHKPLPKKGHIQPQWKFYDKPGGVECLTGPCQKHKGIFLSNARANRATSRSMVSHPSSCYSNPDEPLPTTYYTHNHEITYGIKEIKSPLPNPHLFLRSSIVPMKPISIHPRNISFKPGPGRYENRFPKACACSAKFIYSPNIQLDIEKQKRLKFRRQPYKKINWRRYCSPEWRHVEGHGHRWVFMNPTPMKVEKLQLNIDKAAKKADKTLQLYAEARYINMINDPTRPIMSLRTEPMPTLPIKIKFNCIAKRIVRRQLRNNKKIAFLSSQERFKDAERGPQPTASELAERKKRLPIERQLRNQPITTKPISEVKSKLEKTPMHMLLSYEVALRKRLYKFLPLPGPRILVTKSLITSPEEPMYNKLLVPKNYFLDAQP